MPESVKCSIPRNDGDTPDGVAEVTRQENLVKASALQNAIFNSAMFSKIATDANGVIQIFNVGAENMLGYAAADMMNKITPADISDPHELIVRAKALSLELGTPITPGFEALAFKASRGIEDIYELTYVRKDGSRFPAVVSVTALRDARQAIIGYLLIGTDNTARKQADAAKREHDALLHTIHLHSIVSVTDRGGRIIEVNDGFCKISGYSREELLGQTHRIVNSGTQSRAFWADMWRSITAGQPWRGEICNRTKDGSLYWVDSIIAPFLDEAGATSKYISIRTDVTARKQAEEARSELNAELSRAKLLAESANLAKSDFLSNMSHELRSPLNAILGFAQLIDSGTPAPTPSQKESVDQILQAGWYLLELINEILDLSLIESGKLSLSPEAMSLSEVLADCHAMIEPQAQKSGIRLLFPAFDGPCFIKADRTRVKQVLVNLLSNAIKYNRVGGTVEVSFRHDSPEHVRVSFRDTGAGLSAEKMAQLFQPFNRLGQESGAEEGTGIGLVVSKRLVELMGGRIGADSVVGVGSVFWIELNAIDTPDLALGGVDSKAMGLHEPVPGGTFYTLLCVEDNPANLMLVERLVGRRPDIRLLAARDGNRGIEVARAQRPDAILMDINLPGISGLMALRILADDPLTAAIPVIALSANAMPRDIEKGLDAGFFRYLTKPIKVDEFMETVDMALKRSKTSSNDAAPEGDRMILGASDILNADLLIVDDQEANVRLLERVLREAGYSHVSSTMNPHDVPALHRSNRYDLILLDLHMPGMDGFEVMEALKENDVDSYLSVIVLTAQPAHKLRALQAGAKDFISKPFDLIEVKTRIRNMLEVRLLYKKLESYNVELERTVRERTAELRESELRFRRLTELASDWYWEQNETGAFTQVSGPALEMVGIGMPAFLGEPGGGGATGWNEAERVALQTKIANRQPFLDFAFSRINANGSEQHFRVSGEPMFNAACRFTGYRGIGVEVGIGGSPSPAGA